MSSGERPITLGQNKSELPNTVGNKDGYKFVGWSCNGQLYQPGCRMTMGDSDIILTAKWEEKQYYVVVYVTDGGSLPAPFSKQVLEGETINLEYYSGEKEGYIFYGWGTSDSTYLAGSSFVMPSANVTFLAEWIRASHTVSYDLRGGSEQIPSDIVYEWETFTISSIIPTMEGYIFNGWQYNGMTYVSGSQLQMGQSDIILVAEWGVKSTSLAIDIYIIIASIIVIALVCIMLVLILRTR